VAEILTLNDMQTNTLSIVLLQHLNLYNSGDWTMLPKPLKPNEMYTQVCFSNNARLFTTYCIFKKQTI